eukprot:TRINITY_DN86247_c0_g1_i1.p1 TRINITY_DN86247_c0_g1~~TRINITY_DN86247_c0_g1_i1.p1  ORF type:complete len:1148 (+),score=89.07 TRINITY_DN86247_c0_g1_i1:123-3566(+)
MHTGVGYQASVVGASANSYTLSTGVGSSYIAADGNQNVAIQYTTEIEDNNKAGIALLRIVYNANLHNGGIKRHVMTILLYINEDRTGYFTRQSSEIEGANFVGMGRVFSRPKGNPIVRTEKFGLGRRAQGKRITKSFRWGNSKINLRFADILLRGPADGKDSEEMDMFVGGSSDLTMEATFESAELGWQYSCVILLGEGLRPKVFCAYVDVVAHIALHPVLTTPSIVIDHDGDGKENVELNGALSHTHEQSAAFRHNLVRWDWLVDSSPRGNGYAEKVPTELVLGKHWVSLTVTDDAVPPKNLTEVMMVHVVAANAIPGPQVYLYKGNGNPWAIFAQDQVNLPAADYVGDFSDHFGVRVDASTQNIAGSNLKEDVVVRLVGVIKGDGDDIGPGHLTVQGANAYVLIDGKPYDDEQRKFIHLLTAQDKVLDVRFALPQAVPIIQVFWRGEPILSYSPNGNVQVRHDVTQIQPYIYSVKPTKIPLDQPFTDVAITGVALGSIRTTTVMWEGQVLTPTSVKGKKLVFRVGRQNQPRWVGIQVKNSAGGGSESNWVGLEVTGDATKFEEPIDWLDPIVIDVPGGPTTASWGPDGKFYVATVFGNVEIYEFDAWYNVLSHRTVLTVQNYFKGNQSILGIQVDPYSNSAQPDVYVAHGHIYKKGIGCERPLKEGLKFNGKISRLHGDGLWNLEETITNLPCSNGDLCVNHIKFDFEGNLVWAQAAVTNGGPPACFFGGMEESPLSASINKAAIHRTDFNGNLKYVWKDAPGNEGRVGQDAPDDQRWASLYDITPQSSVGIEAWAHGFHNAFGLEFTTDNELWTTSNGASYGLGPTYAKNAKNNLPCPYPHCKPELIDAFSKDRVHGPLLRNSYWGYPNPNRAQKDERQWEFFAADEPPNPQQYTQGLTVASSTDGIVEIRGSCFRGRLKGDLVAVQWNVQAFRIDRHSDPNAVPTVSVLTEKLHALGLDYGPGCALIGMDFSGNSLQILRPNDRHVAATNDPLAWDITPWRGNPAYNLHLHIGGQHLDSDTRKATNVMIGPYKCNIISRAGPRLTCDLPPRGGGDIWNWLDVKIDFSDGTTAQIFKGFKYGDPKAQRAACVAATQFCTECGFEKCVTCSDGRTANADGSACGYWGRRRSLHIACPNNETTCGI